MNNCLNGTVNLADTLCPPSNSVLHEFTEVIICDLLCIPPEKPDKEHITNTMVNPVVTDVQEISVDLGDGVIRKKAAITGLIKLGIEYSADVPDQQVHFAHFELPFQGVIGYRPCDPNSNRGLNDATFDIDNYLVHVCVEHEQYHQITPREIKAVIVLLIWLEPKP